MTSSNHVKNVAVVGAGGNSGRFVAEALLKNGKHTVTAITRVGSDNKLPQGVVVKQVDYGKQQTIVEALQGQDALIITLSVSAPREVGMQLINAAGEAGVKYILPNEWGPDNTHDGLRGDVIAFQGKTAVRQAIANFGKTSYISVLTGFWYEWSLAIPLSFGFDFAKHTVTFFDDGETKISTSTWPRVGEAVAALLSLPIKAESSNKEACLENFNNKVVFVNSFTISQRDMLESVLRVTGTKEEDWTITKEPSHERYAAGGKEMQQGIRTGFAKQMYSRVFYPDGNGDFESNRGTINGVLGLPKEHLDEATKRAIERSKEPSPF